MTKQMRFRRQQLPLGDDRIPVLVASEGEQPKAVFMSYDAFLELASTLYTAIEALKAAGVDASVLGAADEEEGDDGPTDLDPEFASWDEGFEAQPALRLVVGG